MSYTHFSTDRRKAQKHHTCIWCGQGIAVSEIYLDERSVYDGEIQRQRWHPECSEYAARTHFEEGEEEFTPWDNLRPTAEWIAAHEANIITRFAKTR